MKLIKKSSDTPLVRDEGKIVNNTTSSYDKTKNTYSMEVIDDKINSATGAPEIAISTTQPSGDEVLWINPNEVPSGIGSYISNTYGESQEIGYSQEYINEELTKKQEKLEVKSYTKNVGVIGAGVDYVSNIALESGYTYLGIVGITLSGGFYTFLNVTSNYIYGNTVTTVLHNSATQQTDAITMIIYVLRYKN